MKKIFNFLMSVAVAATTFVGCNDANVEVTDTPTITPAPTAGVYRQLTFADGTVCEFCGDIGMLVGGPNQEDLCEIEVELKDGSEEAAAAFAISLAQEYGLRPETRSKIARAMALANETN